MTWQQVWDEKGFPLERISRLSPGSLYQQQERFHIVDVRSEDEWVGGHIAPSKHLPCSELAARMEEIPNKNLVFVCAGGYRSILAASVAKKLGKQTVSHLSGGLLAWRTAGLTLSV